MDTATPHPTPSRAPSAVPRWVLPRATLPPIWRELGASFAWRSASHPGKPATTPGRGEPVVLVPGFLAGDRSMAVMADYLAAAGYRVHAAGIGANIDCSETTLGVLTARVERLADLCGRRVALVGHSRGGVLARVFAQRRPDLVSGIVALNAPHRDHLAVHPLIWGNVMTLALLGRLGVRGTLRFSCGGGACCRQFWHDLAVPLPASVGALCIYSRTDGVVDWRACADPAGEQLEVVGATHCGVVVHAAALSATAARLARFDAAGALPAAELAIALDPVRLAA